MVRCMVATDYQYPYTITSVTEKSLLLQDFLAAAIHDCSSFVNAVISMIAVLQSCNAPWLQY